MNKISYNQIYKNFNSDNWDFSYLTYNEIWETLNHPIKYQNIIEKLTFFGIDFPKNVTFLVVVHLSPDFDYTLVNTFQNICKEKIPNLQYQEFFCNYKYAAVQSGLGQYAKNSLFYHPKFQFDTHLAVFIIFNELTDLPKRNKPNFNLLKQCEHCNDCINACPVNAIHYNNNQGWIDLYKCDNFCHFGNHHIIPSIKWNWLKIGDYNLTDNQIYNIHTFADLRNNVGQTDCTNIIKKNNKKYNAIFPVCRECVSQKKCSKYNGQYPYDWNNIKLQEIADEEKV